MARPNWLSGLGGLFGGAAQGYEQYQDMQMRKLLLNAQLTQMGATQGNGPTLDVPQVPTDQAANTLASVAGSTPLPPPNLNAPPPMPPGALAQAQAATQAAQGVAGQIPSNVVAQNLVSPSAGVIPQTSAGTTTPQLPTDQASIIRMNRAAQGGSAGATTAAVAGPATAGAGSLLAALQAANAQVPSGAPTKGAAPTGVDTVGGADSGLDPGIASVLAKYQAAMTPTGRVPIGGKWTMPQVLPPQQAAMQGTVLQVLANAAAAQAERKFESGQQAAQLAAQAGNVQTEQGGANARAQLEATTEGKRLDLETANAVNFMKRFNVGVDTKALSAATADLSTNYEKPALALRSAINEINIARTHPSAATAANLQAFLSQATGPGGNAPQVRAQLIDIAGGAANESAEGKLARGISMITHGTNTPGQLNDLVNAMTEQYHGIAQQYDQAILAQAASHPESPAMIQVLQARRGFAFPDLAGQGAGAAATSHVPGNPFAGQ